MKYDIKELLDGSSNEKKRKKLYYLKKKTLFIKCKISAKYIFYAHELLLKS